MSVVDGKDELDSDWFKDVYVKYGKIPIRRYAMPAEIAEHVAWLSSGATRTRRARCSRSTAASR